MFTGIVQGIGIITARTSRGSGCTIRTRLPHHAAHHLQVGASVAHNGCCLTIIEHDGDEACFDVMDITLRTTNLGYLRVGDPVNIERSARMGDELGGHIMSGHIMRTVAITQVEQTPDTCTIWLERPAALAPYIFAKGFIGLDGCSLTIAEVQDTQFNVHLIPETRSRTIFGRAQPGGHINIEIDAHTQAIVDTTQRIVQHMLHRSP